MEGHTCRGQCHSQKLTLKRKYLKRGKFYVVNGQFSPFIWDNNRKKKVMAANCQNVQSQRTQSQQLNNLHQLYFWSWHQLTLQSSRWSKCSNRQGGCCLWRPEMASRQQTQQHWTCPFKVTSPGRQGHRTTRVWLLRYHRVISGYLSCVMIKEGRLNFHANWRCGCHLSLILTSQEQAAWFQ